MRSLSDAVRVPRLRWPLVVLLLSIGLTAVAAFEAQRAVRSQRTLAEHALREYASFAAWSYAEHLFITMNNMEREAIGAVNHGENMHTNPRVPAARDLAHYLPWDDHCQCHRTYAGPGPQTFFAVNVRARELSVGVNSHVNPDEGWNDTSLPTDLSLPPKPDPAREAAEQHAYAPGEREWLIDSLTARVRRHPDLDHGFTFVVDQATESPRIFAYTLMPTSWGDTLIYGARYTRESLIQVLSTVLDQNGLLPATFTEGRKNREVLAVSVRDSAGRPLFISDSSIIDMSLGRHIDMPTRIGSLQIDAMIRPQLAGTVLIGGLPASRLPFLLGLLGLAAALSIVAVAQIRREGEIARLRADFVSSVSHELRTPLAQIRLYLETLQLGRTSTDEQRKWALSHIERETTRLSHLVENVLRFSTLGHDAATSAPIDPAKEVRTIVEGFAPLAASRHASVVVDASEATPVRVRPEALRHIVINLLDNAIKYGPPNQTVLVTVARQNGGVAISVDDEGPGIPPNERDTIWKPFTRGEFAAEKGGSGIGLTIVREVAMASGGEAWVEDGQRGGARFVVTLPVDLPHDASES
ncbi:MAG TPA: HAMP domain-containing sensor histidine kinase [Gemmatimonadaceae bacterium]